MNNNRDEEFGGHGLFCSSELGGGEVARYVAASHSLDDQ